MTEILHRAIIFFVAIVAIVAAGCSRRPDGVLSKGDMASLLADIHQGEGVIENERGTYYNDSLRRLLKQSIYQRHGVTREQVDSSMMWYGMHVEEYMEVYDKVIEILEKRQREAEALSSQTREAGSASTSLSLEGDSVDVWTLPRHLRFYDLAYNNYITYRINKDSYWQEGDRYTLRLKAINPRFPVDALVMVEYFDQSVDISNRSLHGPGWHEVSLSLNPDKDARAVYVSINYEPAADESMHLDSISLLRQRHRFTLPPSPSTTPEDAPAQ